MLRPKVHQLSINYEFVILRTLKKFVLVIKRYLYFSSSMYFFVRTMHLLILYRKGIEILELMKFKRYCDFNVVKLYRMENEEG